MTILITGSTGLIGTHLLSHLCEQNLSVHPMTRDPSGAVFPSGVTAVAGDMLDVESMRQALDETSTLFLLNAVTPQEFSQALLTLNLAREAGVQRVVYLSVFNGKPFSNVPHFAAKHAVEQMIEDSGIPATILRANCYMQNDTMFKDALLGVGVYPFPIGEKGVSMVDARDVAELAARALIERESAPMPLPGRTINVVGPEPLTGSGNAAIWSNLLDKTVTYPGNSTALFEKMVSKHAPSWLAMDLRLMLERFQQDGMVGTPADVVEMTTLLGRPLRTYTEFAKETLSQWQASA